MMEVILFICAVFKQKCWVLLSCVLEINFFVQLIMFLILLISGDIESNPGPSSLQSLDILHLNIRSIRNKIDSVKHLIQDFHILCFTETHLDPNVLDGHVLIEGFKNIFRRDRNSFGGGVMIYVSNCLKVRRREDLEPSDTEIIWIEIAQTVGSLLLCCIYRPPNSNRNFWHKLSWSVEKANDISQNMLILGDLNVDFLKLNTTHEFHTIMESYSLANIIQQPTRITRNTSTLIDPIIISENIQVHDSGIINVDHSISDHRAAYAPVM